MRAVLYSVHVLKFKSKDMRRIFLSISFTAFSSLLLSCSVLSCGDYRNDGNEMEYVSIPFDQITSIDVSDGEVIPLETTDESLLSSVTGIEMLRGDYLVSTSNSVTKFDKKGRFLTNIGALGHSASEYLDTKSLFVSADQIHIFDWSLRKVNTYDATGQYLSKVDIQPGENNVYPGTLYLANNGTFLSNNCYQGEDISTPEFSVFSPSGTLMHHIDGLYKKEGTTHNELRFSPSTNTLLYAEAFSDTIYRIDPSGMTAKKAYYIDFGEHKFTEEEKAGKDFIEMCSYSNLEENIKTKASFLYCCYETADKLMFLFIYQAPLFVIYDKDSYSTHVFRLEDKTGKLNPILFAAYTEDDVLFLCEDVNDMKSNPIIVRIPCKKMLKK